MAKDNTKTQRDDQGSVNELPDTNAVGTLPQNPGVSHRPGLVKTFATETLPGLLYLHLLLRIPYLYFSRMNKIFSEAQLAIKEIKRMALWVGASDGDRPHRSRNAYLRLEARWKEFVDALMEEWKTLNMISALLLV